MPNNNYITENLLSLDLDFFKLNFLYESVNKIYNIKFKEYMINEDNNYLYTEGWNQKKIEKQKSDLKQLKKDKDEKKTNIIKKMIDRILDFIRVIKEKIMNAFNVTKEKVIVSTLSSLNDNTLIDIDVDGYEEKLKILLNEQKEVNNTLDKIKKGNLKHSDVEKLKKTRETNSNKIKKLRNKVDRAYSTASDIAHIGKTVAKTAVIVGGVAVSVHKAIKFWKFVKSQSNTVNAQETYFKNFQNNYGNSSNVSNDDCQSVFNEAQQSYGVYSNTIFDVIRDYEKMADEYKDETQTTLNNETLQDAKKVDKAYKSYMTELCNKMIHANEDELKIGKDEYKRIITQLRAENKSFKQSSKHSLMDMKQLTMRIESLYKQCFKGTSNVSNSEFLRIYEKIKDADNLYNILSKKDVKILSTKI